VRFWQMAEYNRFAYIAVIIFIKLFIILSYCCFRLQKRREIKERLRNSITQGVLAQISVQRDERQQNHSVNIIADPPPPYSLIGAKY